MSRRDSCSNSPPGCTYSVIDCPTRLPVGVPFVEVIDPVQFNPDTQIDPNDLPVSLQAILPDATTKPSQKMVIYLDNQPIEVKKPARDPPIKFHRCKYGCPECDTVAWARPKARLMCADHMRMLEVLSKV